MRARDERGLRSAKTPGTYITFNSCFFASCSLNNSSSSGNVILLRSCFLRLLRSRSPRTHEIAKVFYRGETRVVVWPAIDDLPFLRHIFAPGAQRLLDDAQRPVAQRQHLIVFVTYEL